MSSNISKNEVDKFFKVFDSLTSSEKLRFLKIVKFPIKNSSDVNKFTSKNYSPRMKGELRAFLSIKNLDVPKTYANVAKKPSKSGINSTVRKFV
jgi:hypothetical protein